MWPGLWDQLDPRQREPQPMILHPRVCPDATKTALGHDISLGSAYVRHVLTQDLERIKAARSAAEDSSIYIYQDSFKSLGFLANLGEWVGFESVLRSWTHHRNVKFIDFLTLWWKIVFSSELLFFKIGISTPKITEIVFFIRTIIFAEYRYQ